MKIQFYEKQNCHLGENPAPPECLRVVLRVFEDGVEREEGASYDDVVRGVVGIRTGVYADGVAIGSLSGLRGNGVLDKSFESSTLEHCWGHLSEHHMLFLLCCSLSSLLEGQEAV